MLLALIGVLFWLIETWYFGWNLFAESDAERWCDRIAMCLIVAGCTEVVVAWARRIEKKLDIIVGKQPPPLTPVDSEKE